MFITKRIDEKIFENIKLGMTPSYILLGRNEMQEFEDFGTMLDPLLTESNQAKYDQPLYRGIPVIEVIKESFLEVVT